MVLGSGFGATKAVRVSGRFPLVSGGSRVISTTVTTNSSGGFTTFLSVPQDAAAGAATITGSNANGQASQQVPKDYQTLKRRLEGQS